MSKSIFNLMLNAREYFNAISELNKKIQTTMEKQKFRDEVIRLTNRQDFEKNQGLIYMFNKSFRETFLNCLKLGADMDGAYKAIYVIKDISQNSMLTPIEVTELHGKFLALSGVIKMNHKKETSRVKPYGFDKIKWKLEDSLESIEKKFGKSTVFEIDLKSEESYNDIWRDAVNANKKQFEKQKPCECEFVIDRKEGVHRITKYDCPSCKKEHSLEKEYEHIKNTIEKQLEAAQRFADMSSDTIEYMFERFGIECNCVLVTTYPDRRCTIERCESCKDKDKAYSEAFIDTWSFLFEDDITLVEKEKNECQCEYVTSISGKIYKITKCNRCKDE